MTEENEIIESTQQIGFVAVDSGQLMLCDPCYVIDFFSDEEYNPQPADENGFYPFSYNGACGATISNEMAGQLHFNRGYAGAGVAFATGYGDGLYPVYATYRTSSAWGKRIAKIEIVFIDEDEEIMGDDYDA